VNLTTGKEGEIQKAGLNKTWIAEVAMAGAVAGLGFGVIEGVVGNGVTWVLLGKCLGYVGLHWG
jgi:hypothetical protein